MKMTCPHCGISGSAGDSLLGTKVRCPKCSKVFIVEGDLPHAGIAAPSPAEEVVAREVDIPAEVPSETLDYDILDEIDDEPQAEEVIEEIEAEEIEIVEESGDEVNIADIPTEPCAGCGESFHPDFLQEVESKLYCGICQPEVVEEQDQGQSPATALLDSQASDKAQKKPKKKGSSIGRILLLLLILIILGGVAVYFYYPELLTNLGPVTEVLTNLGLLKGP
ncbi:MAG: hypothetical protein ABFS19_05130 [Thermodesulfobacteriota bacterium]